MYIAPSGVLKKLRNMSSKQTFDSIYRYRCSHHLSSYRETRQSTSRLKAALIPSCEASCVLYVCTSYSNYFHIMYIGYPRIVVLYEAMVLAECVTCTCHTNKIIIVIIKGVLGIFSQS